MIYYIICLSEVKNKPKIYSCSSMYSWMFSIKIWLAVSFDLLSLTLCWASVNILCLFMKMLIYYKSAFLKFLRDWYNGYRSVITTVISITFLKMGLIFAILIKSLFQPHMNSKIKNDSKGYWRIKRIKWEQWHRKERDLTHKSKIRRVLKQ